jgi:hypothetical protein
VLFVGLLVCLCVFFLLCSSPDKRPDTLSNVCVCCRSLFLFCFVLCLFPACGVRNTTHFSFAFVCLFVAFCLFSLQPSFLSVVCLLAARFEVVHVCAHAREQLASVCVCVCVVCLSAASVCCV